MTDQQQIDDLLVQYLSLVDEYSRLREELSSLQRGIYQDLARANFSAERGLRYGQDHYDERMQASRKLDIAMNKGQDVPVFSVTDFELPANDDDEEETDTPQEEDKKTRNDDEDGQDNSSADSIPRKEETQQHSVNPLRWFGILSPPSLRNAQTQSVQAITSIIPQLVSVNSKMLDIEIQVRRARKKRSKLSTASQPPLLVKEDKILTTQTTA